MGRREAKLYDPRRATDRALRHVEISADTGCTPEAFARALKTGCLDDASRLAVTLFLDEGEPDSIVEIVGADAASFATLAQLAATLLAPDHPTRAFLAQAPS